jgi:transcriptional regulator with XRE-family HTH domain
MNFTMNGNKLVITFEDKVFGNFLKFRRAALGLTRSDLVFLLDRKVTAITISNWENEITLPKAIQLKGLSSALQADSEAVWRAWAVSQKKRIEAA